MTDTTNALRALDMAVSRLRECVRLAERARQYSHGAEAANKMMRNDHEALNKLAALATAQPEAKPEGVAWRAKAVGWLHKLAPVAHTHHRCDASNAADAVVQSIRAAVLEDDKLRATRQAQGGGEGGPRVACRHHVYHLGICADCREATKAATRPPEDTER